MPPETISGARLVFRTLDRLGVRIAFGLPSTQTVPLYDGLRVSRLRSVVTTHELGATFAAIGHYRASGRVAVVLAMPGPGVAYALAGIAEARQDSAALLLLTVRGHDATTARRSGRPDFPADPAGPFAKETVRVGCAADIPAAVTYAFRCATSGEPGPVVIELSNDAVIQPTAVDVEGLLLPDPGLHLRPDDALALARVIGGARRPLLIAGQGAANASDSLEQLAAILCAPVLTTGSGRGCLPEDHPLAMAYDAGIRGPGPIGELLERADVLLVLGAKFVYSGTGGLRMPLRADKVVIVDPSEEISASTVQECLKIRADVGAALRVLVQHARDTAHHKDGWDRAELQSFKNRCQSAMASAVTESPVVPGHAGGLAGLFGALRAHLPRDACVVTDSGLHQMLTRAHFPVLAPRGLITPANFQSMGFGLPAAMGASLGCPDKQVVAVLGDGGLAMSGMELLTAVREETNVLALVFNDGGLGLIRRRQLEGDGVDFSVNVDPPDLELFAEAVGVSYARLSDDADSLFGGGDLRRGVHLVEVPLLPTRRFRVRRARNRLLEAARTRVGRGYLSRLRRWVSTAGW